MKPKKTRVKSVEFAQPLSYTAARFGCGKRGCWTVQVGNAGEPLEAITSHSEREAALRHAAGLGAEWDSSFASVHPADVARFPASESRARIKRAADSTRNFVRSI
jgi:hypothetical protein